MHFLVLPILLWLSSSVSAQANSTVAVANSTLPLGNSTVASSVPLPLPTASSSPSRDVAASAGGMGAAFITSPDGGMNVSMVSMPAPVSGGVPQTFPLAGPSVGGEGTSGASYGGGSSSSSGGSYGGGGGSGGSYGSPSNGYSGNSNAYGSNSNSHGSYNGGYNGGGSYNSGGENVVTIIEDKTIKIIEK